jgi:hypothetical protein
MFSERIASSLRSAFGGGLYFAFCIFLMAAVPCLIFGAAAMLWGRARGAGAICGLMVAVWASASWVCVPYCGGYPNLPGLLAAAAFTPSCAAQECAIHMINFTLWPFAVAALFKVARKQPQGGFEPQPPRR